jgi:hypothetical protein
VPLEELVKVNWNNRLQLVQPIHYLVSLLTLVLALNHYRVGLKGYFL